VVPPRDKLEAHLVQIWEAVFQLKPISVQDNFFELGGHSLLAVRLCGQMERVVGRALPPSLLFQAPTIAQLARLVRQEGRRLPSSVVPIQPSGAQPPLFCVHGYDGYLALTRHLGPEQPLYGLVQHLPGQPVRHTRVEDIAAHYLQEMRMLQAEGPYFLCGHSFGGLVAFEMAQQLVGQGQRVSFLGLLDPLPLTAPAEAPGRLASSGLRSRPLSRLAPLRRLRALPARVLYRLKEAVCLTYHGLGRPLPARLYRFYVEEVVYGRFYARAARAYVPRRYAGRITLFTTAHGGAVVAADWEGVAAGGLEVYEAPGTHLTMIQEPHVRTLVEKVRACLARAQEGIAGSERLRTVLSMLVSAWQLAALG
jgi:aspartate racemase